MNKRWDIPETSVTVRRITKAGDDEDGQDCVAGIEIGVKGMISLDLRNLRPLRVNDRDSLVVEIYLADILEAVANKLEAVIND